jgi:hypothetical protein
MNRRTTIATLCMVAVIAWTGAVSAQTSTSKAMKTVKLPTGEEVFDLSGKWDVKIENYGELARYGSYPQTFQITQEGKSFTGIRLQDNPPPSPGRAGSRSAQGEVDKSGIRKMELVTSVGAALSTKWQVSEDGNRIDVDAPGFVRQTWTRK